MTTTEYTTDVMALNGGMTYFPTTKIAFTISGNFSTNEASFDPVIMPDVPAEIIDEVEENIHAANYDYSMIHEYSDLSYQILDLSMKLDYMFSARVSWNAELLYHKFNDDNGYIFGDETGSIYLIRTGITYGL